MILANMLGLHWADWIVLFVYLIGITIVGIWSSHKVKDLTDFFMGGRRFGKVFMMFFAFGAGTSSDQAVTVAAGSFRNGLAGIWYQFLWLWATPFYWIVAPVMRRMRALTTSDFFESRYNSSTALLYSIFGIMISIIFIASALFGGAEMVEGLAGGINPETGKAFFPKSYAIAGMTVMFVLYGMAGGLGAAVITDFIQGILTIILSFLLLPFAFALAAQTVNLESGFAALQQGIPGRPGEDLLSLTLNAELAMQLVKEPITPFYVIMLSMTGLTGIVVQPHIMGVCGAGKTEFEGRFGFTVGNFLKRFCTIAWAFTGLACVILYLSPETNLIDPAFAAEMRDDPEKLTKFADQVFGRAAHDILPTIAPGLVGLLFASLLAAIMSTCDAQMVVSSGLFTENIYKRYFVKTASPKHYLWVGRLSGLVIVALALLFQTQFNNIIQVMTAYVLAVPTFMGMAFWFGITWRGYTPKAVWVSTIATGLLWYLTTKHTPFDSIAAWGDINLLKENVDYFPRLFREWLWNVAPVTKSEILNSAGEVVTTKVSLPIQVVIYLGGGALAGVLTSFVTKRTPKERLDHFFLLLRTPVRAGEEVDEPCTLPENPLPPDEGKLIPLADLEIPFPSRIGMIGFVISWIGVAAVIGLTWWLAQLGQ